MLDQNTVYWNKLALKYHLEYS